MHLITSNCWQLWLRCYMCGIYFNACALMQIQPSPMHLCLVKVSYIVHHFSISFYTGPCEETSL
jgi:hypothetical protein